MFLVGFTGSTASLHTLGGSIGTPVGVGVTRSVSPALAQYQFTRGASPLMTQARRNLEQSRNEAFVFINFAVLGHF